MTRYNITNCSVCNFPLSDDWRAEKVCPYCNTRYDCVTPKTDRSKTMISPSDCRHSRPLFISGSRDLSEHGSGSHTVTICPDCGLFFVTGWRDGVGFKVTFDLATDETVEAAGKWCKLLDSEEYKQADKSKLYGPWMRRDA